MSDIAKTPAPPQMPPPGPAATAPQPGAEALAAASTDERLTQWRRLRRIYMRVVALIFLAAGLHGWMVALGVLTWDGQSFLEIRAPVRNAMSAFAVLDLVVAIGLWLTANWGPVLMAADVLLWVMLHTVYADIHGSSPVSSLFWLGLLAGFIALTLLVFRENHMADALRRKLRKEARGRA